MTFAMKILGLTDTEAQHNGFHVERIHHFSICMFSFQKLPAHCRFCIWWNNEFCWWNNEIILFAGSCCKTARPKWSPRKSRIFGGSSHAQSLTSSQSCELNWLLCRWWSAAACLWIYAIGVFGGSFTRSDCILFELSPLLPELLCFHIIKLLNSWFNLFNLLNVKKCYNW